MAELAQLVIEVTAAADEAQETLRLLLESVRGLAAACEERLDLYVNYESVLGARGAVQGLGRELEAAREAGEAMEDAAGSAGELLDAYRSLESRTASLDRKTDTLARAHKAMESAVSRGTRTIGAAGKEARALADDLGYTGDSLDTLGAMVPAYASSLAGELERTAASARGLSAEMAGAAAASNITGSVQVDCASALSALSGLIATAQAALSVLGALGVASAGTAQTTARRSGGGGGRRSAAEDEAEAARRAAEEAERRRREAIEADYRAIEHRRHMNEITYEEELELLEQLRRKHRLNAEEIMEWEEKVYDLRQEIRERDAASLDSLSDGVLTALENRYEAMLEAERQRLDESRDSWEKWRDERVAAIEEQIAALDRLADAQDREKQDAEELRKIAKLEQLIAYEQDDYNRAKLTQQLDQAVREREERLRSLALEDEKEALRAQIEAIEKEADARLEALEREEADVEAAYAQRMEEAALRAEAEKLILTQSQDELLSLIKSYAPAYDAAGQTLGEKLLEGFSEKVGSIAQWFEDFNAQIARAQAEVAGASQEAAGRFYQERGLTVHQTVTFNEPVDSPAQVARRVEQANRELALML